MNRHIIFVFLLFIYTSISGKNIIISTENTSLFIEAEVGKPLLFCYYGNKIDNLEAEQLKKTNMTFHRSAYPEFNRECSDECALMVEHSDGSIAIDLVVTDIQKSVKDDGELIEITSEDKKYPFKVKNCYLSYPKANVIEIWSEISHSEKKGDVLLKQFASAYLPFWGDNVWITHMNGSWGSEAGLFEEPLSPGLFTVKYQDGTRNGHTSRAEIMLSLDGKPCEHTGRMIGAALCWTGNYRMRIDTDLCYKYVHHFFAGINETSSEYYLKKGVTFITPPLALSYSSNGKSGISRNFHSWARQYKIYGGKKIKDVLLNSWEGVYMDISFDKMKKMMNDVSKLGGELFVMDDGWFASKKYKRTDSTGLGDWTVDLDKLPNGILSLTEETKKNNIKFGIWIEPEAANWGNSDLWEKHPDWFLRNEGYDMKLGRGGTQAALDLTNPEVQDFVFNVVDKIMQSNKDISYIKWDENVGLVNFGSKYLPKNRQSHIYIDYHLGLQKVFKRIRNKYPHLVMQACAGGGGRVSYGFLPYFDEFWTSDNTDAWQRVFIQWGTSHFFPACAMAAHVSASPNHQSGRVLPLKFRFDVAMSGRLGIEMKPSDFTADEFEFAKQAIYDYKRLREIIQQGNIYRLVSPYEKKKDFASLMYVSEDKKNAVFYIYKMRHYVNQHIPSVQMAGLDSNKNYSLNEINVEKGQRNVIKDIVVSGNVLMNSGIRINLDNEYSSKIIELKEIE